MCHGVSKEFLFWPKTLLNGLLSLLSCVMPHPSPFKKSWDTENREAEEGHLGLKGHPPLMLMLLGPSAAFPALTKKAGPCEVRRPHQHLFSKWRWQRSRKAARPQGQIRPNEYSITIQKQMGGREARPNSKAKTDDLIMYGSEPCSTFENGFSGGCLEIDSGILSSFLVCCSFESHFMPALSHMNWD